MATAARDRLARTLRGDVQNAFSVEMAAKTDDLSLDVEGFGRVKFPVTPAKARKLATDTDGGAGTTITTKTMTSTPAARAPANASTTSRS